MVGNQGTSVYPKKHHKTFNFLTLSLINMQKYFPGMFFKVVIIWMNAKRRLGAGRGAKDELSEGVYVRCHLPGF